MITAPFCSDDAVPREWAIHEAGHAVASIALGLDFHDVSVLTAGAARAGQTVETNDGNDLIDAVGLMRCPGFDILPRSYVPVEVWPRRRHELERRIIRCFAGPEAERFDTRQHWLSIYVGGSDGDMNAAGRLARYAADAGEDPSALVERLRRRAIRLVRLPAVWTAIGAVPDALQARRALSFVDVLAAAGCTFRFSRPATWPDGSTPATKIMKWLPPLAATLSERDRRAA